MRSTFLTRRRSQLEQSKNKRFRQITKFGALLPSTPDSSINLSQLTDLFKDIFKIEFNEQGEILTSTHAQPNDQGWLLHHRSLEIAPLLYEGRERRFSVTYDNIQLKNKKGFAINVPGELKFTVIENEKNNFRIEKTETNSPILDTIVMGENLGLLNLMKRRLTGSCDLSACENEIKKAIEHEELSSTRRIAYMTALVAIEAVNSRPSYAPSVDAPYQEKVDKLVFAAWELYHETPDNSAAALEKHAFTIQGVKHVLIETDQTNTLNVMLRQLEEEASVQLAVSEIDITLLTSIGTLENRLFQSNKAKESLEKSIRLEKSEKAKAFYKIVEGSLPNIKTEAVFKNPGGLLRHKVLCLESNRQILNQCFIAEEEQEFSRAVSIKLEEAISKTKQLLYFKATSAGNPLLNSLAEVLPKNPKNTAAATSVDDLIARGKNELLRESKDAKWLQILRSWFQPLRSQQVQLKIALNEIAEKNIPFSDKLSEMEKATLLSMKSSKPSAWAVWRKPVEEKDFKNIQRQAQTLCALQAFSQNNIQEEEFIQVLGNCGHAATAHIFQEKFNALEKAAKIYMQESVKCLADEFREQGLPSLVKETSVELRASLNASPKLRNLAPHVNVWAERQKFANTLASGLETTPVIETAVGLVH